MDKTEDCIRFPATGKLVSGSRPIVRFSVGERKFNFQSDLRMGDIRIGQGDVHDSPRVYGIDLIDFLNNHKNGMAPYSIVTEPQVISSGRLVHGVAARDHLTSSMAPTLRWTHKTDFEAEEVNCPNKGFK